MRIDVINRMPLFLYTQYFKLTTSDSSDIIIQNVRVEPYF